MNDSDIKQPPVSEVPGKRRLKRGNKNSYRGHCNANHKN